MKKILFGLLLLSLIACNNDNDRKDVRYGGDSVSPMPKDTFPTNDTNSYQRMNDKIPDSL